MEEKRTVFQLPSVRRSMRYLDHSHVLMDKHVLDLQHKYMEAAPQRASLLEIGHAALQDVCPHECYFDELRYISPLLATMAALRGENVPGYIFANLSLLGEIAFYVVSIQRDGNTDIISVSSLIVTTIMLLFNSVISAGVAFHPELTPLSCETRVDNVGISGISFLQLYGLEVLGKAQVKMANSNGGGGEPSSQSSLLKLKEKLVSETGESLDVCEGAEGGAVHER